MLHKYYSLIDMHGSHRTPSAVTDLNHERVRGEGGWEDGQPLQDYQAASADGQAEVYFRDLESHLCRHIRSADLVVGCVAWLTSFPILESLSSVPYGVGLVVQKEDFLRPDIAPHSEFAQQLRTAYGKLHGPDVDRYHFPGILGDLSVCGDPGIDSVRCVGNHNASKRAAMPRMHNKFLVLCSYTFEGFFNEELCCYLDKDGMPTCPKVSPYAVWTGSFNFTKNAGFSLENAVVLKDEAICTAYFNEWQQIEGLSEPLDWETPWVTPQWRIGT